LAIDWGRAFALHLGWLRGVVRTRLGEDQAVDEVVQEVALAAVRQNAPIQDRGRIAGWLHRIAVRACLMHRRQAGRRRRLTESFARRVRPSGIDAEDPPAWLFRAERRELLREAIGRLPSSEAELLLLKHGEGLTAGEIAARTGLTVPAVETRLSRARTRLRAMLASLEDSSP
jgi:RNA polymerase sigma-70 factor (ECF subfamily)